MSSQKTPLSTQVKNTQAPIPQEELAAGQPIQGPDLLLEGGLFWEKYKLPIIAAAALLVLALVISEFYQINHEKTLANASAQFDAAKTPADFQKVIDDYPGTPAAANAAMLKGRAQMDAKDYAGAAKTWRAFADASPGSPLAVTALIGAGGALAADGKSDEARAAYQKAATSYANSFAAPLARLDEANLLKSQRKFEDARRVYEDLIASAPKSVAAQIAQEELHTLHALPPPMAYLPEPTPTPVPVAAASPVPAVPVVNPVPAASATPAPAMVAPAPAVVPASPSAADTPK